MPPILLALIQASLPSWQDLSPPNLTGHSSQESYWSFASSRQPRAVLERTLLRDPRGSGLGIPARVDARLRRSLRLRILSA